MKRTFEQWLHSVNEHLTALCGMDYRDLPDCCYMDWYEAKMSPKAAAKKAIKNAGE